jgi:predicted thioesterase
VLSTPSLIWFLEHAARRALSPLLEDRETCVGTQIEIQHLAPTPLGERVCCRARVIGVDGRQINFQVEAHDQHELIARGLHKRAVVPVDRFASRVLRKTSGSDGTV